MAAPKDTKSSAPHTPFVSADKNLPELTGTAICLGIVLAIVMAASNAYLALYAGMTVSASIPASVISMAILRGVLKRGSILENNMVQTITSAGESVAAGIIFTVPALVMIGAWPDFKFWPTTLIAICGGVLGIVFMVPLRRALIVEDKTLTYPEGVACAEVLKSGEAQGTGFVAIRNGMIMGAIIKFASTGMSLMVGTLEWAGSVAGRMFYFGSDVSPALMGVGYICGTQVALMTMIGGLIGWSAVLPNLTIPPELVGSPALDIAWALWKAQIRYVGVGAMVVCGLWSVVRVRHGIIGGFRSILQSYRDRALAATIRRTDRDMSLGLMLLLSIVAIGLTCGLYYSLLQSLPIAVAATGLMIIGTFLFMAVSSYTTGLVGASNDPVSGMTICALLGTGGVLLVLGVTGTAGVVATLGVAGVVCVAAAMASDISQELKTGYILGATPAKQEIAVIIGTLASAFVLAPTLTMLHHAYGIGVKLRAPQASLFASLAKSMFGDSTLPRDMLCIGLVIGVLLVLCDETLRRRQSSFRTPPMAVALGIYLPVTMSAPIFLGGLVRLIFDRRKSTAVEGSEPGVLLSSGLIAGEAIMGIIIALLIGVGVQEKMTLHNVPEVVSVGTGFVALMMVIFAYRRVTRAK